jgi:catechol 2,3-dioxygenase-like lactoylglutathione lyase family enzyme
MVLGVNHSAIKVKDIKKISEFYKNIIGFKEAFSVNNNSGEMIILVLHINRGVYLELAYDQNADINYNPQHNHMFYEEYKRMNVLGIPVENEVKKR